MAVLLDKLKRRGIQRMGMEGATPTTSMAQAQSPLPTITDQISQPPARQDMSLAGRIGARPQLGELGSLPQNKGISKRFIADLPAKVQLQGIQDILQGQETTSPVVNNFVRGMAAQGKSPEEIIAAFKQQQKASGNPLVLM